MGQATNDPNNKGLIAELNDGSAGWGMRLMVSIASAAAFAGACGMISHLIAVIYPTGNRGGRGSATIYINDEMAAVVFGCGALLYLVFLAWLWSRGKSGRGRVILYATVGTVCTIAAVVIVGVQIERIVFGDKEYLIAADILFGIFVIFIIWVQAYRKFGRGRPKVNTRDGKFDVRCPECGYRMVGLTESRCPECGTSFTLDQLLGSQDFRKEQVRSTPALNITPDSQSTDTNVTNESA